MLENALDGAQGVTSGLEPGQLCHTQIELVERRVYFGAQSLRRALERRNPGLHQAQHFLQRFYIDGLVEQIFMIGAHLFPDLFVQCVDAGGQVGQVLAQLARLHHSRAQALHVKVLLAELGRVHGRVQPFNQQLDTLRAHLELKLSR
ncbi:hypothetical protein BpHYR1_048146 [Brachionus plicatilis]|uniref:Uncharacterized protein n=1 Tax=Brachionus plicatilis TaxID=10195 RepID=A0A3M7T099_BRAPC|nr:hypothetical protein BpHYR1_048146 [Brachionus plicatilis]